VLPSALSRRFQRFHGVANTAMKNHKSALFFSHKLFDTKTIIEDKNTSESQVKIVLALENEI
jgi:hypothetical protein